MFFHLVIGGIDLYGRNYGLRRDTHMGPVEIQTLPKTAVNCLLPFRIPRQFYDFAEESETVR